MNRKVKDTTEEVLPREGMLQRGRVAIGHFANACEDDKHLRSFGAAVFLPKCRLSGLLHGEVVARVKESIAAFWAVLDP